MARIRTKPIPVRTVPEELHKLWLSNKRKKDAEKIVALAIEKNAEATTKLYPTSKPTIEKALLYGHCLDENLRNLINQYFEDRNKVEIEQTRHLKQNT